MRNFLVSQMVEDLIGPLSGPHENQNFKPTERYITGVLAPRKTDKNQAAPLQDECIDVSLGSTEQKLTSPEDSIDNGVSAVGGDEGLSPVIDPRSYPKNMGLSFNVQHPDKFPDYSLAITYARYSKQGERWIRCPRAITVSSAEIDAHLEFKDNRKKGRVFLNVKNTQNGILEMDEKGDGESYLFSSIRPAHKHELGTIVTLMLVNNLSQEGMSPGSDEFCEQLFFQPEIRVCFADGTSFVQNGVEPEDTTSEAYEDFRYRGREQHARGHLCSATWGGFDPQQLSEGDREDLMVQYLKQSALESGETARELESMNLANAPPFWWVDGGHPALESTDNKFRIADVRTEYMPMIVLPAPEMDPSGSAWAQCPTAEELSLADDANSILNLLNPLLEGYEAWISSELAPGPPGLDSEAKRVLSRMKVGVALLASDETVRRAFNLANRSIHLSNEWQRSITGRGQDFRWRKFQLAFALLSLESIANPTSEDRSELDLLWVATGGGKTESYLLLMAFAIVVRRLQAQKDPSLPQWHGVDVLTRYTLRLLTIQQSRRTSRMVTALEYIRNTGWSPNGEYNRFSEQVVSLGVWVGGSLTPNKLSSGKDAQHMKQLPNRDLPGLSAVRLLRFGHQLTPDQKKKAAEPAQLQNCPACDAHLAFPLSSTSAQSVGQIHWVCTIRRMSQTALESLTLQNVSAITAQDHSDQVWTLSLTLEEEVQSEADIVSVWKSLEESIRSQNGQIFGLSARPARPGYFLKKKIESNKDVMYDFETHCPDPRCVLNQRQWTAEAPAGVQEGPYRSSKSYFVASGWKSSANGDVARGMPIPMYSVDKQIYNKCPSIIVATVDKFAQLPKNTDSGHLFGVVDTHTHGDGYSRRSVSNRGEVDMVPGGRLLPPSLVVQDELHLIEGPLGSMVGFYETAIDKLFSETPTFDKYQVKYIASSATINKGEEQVQCLFNRRTTLFPPKGRDWKDRGFIIDKENENPSSKGDDKGRLYFGICPIGVTGLSTQRELFASILLHAASCVEANGTPSDRFWTAVGYYNAVRELAGARTLLSFEVQQAIQRLQDHRLNPNSMFSRPDQEQIVELSGRLDSANLPQLLNNLEQNDRNGGSATDVLLATSMFGTGVDVDRLNLMVVAGQPKTTAQYIQAAGRVGRRNGGLILSYLRSSRPRDLDHYERFIGYHAQLHRHVEAVTVRPFAIPVIERAGGPVQIAWLRNSRTVGPAFGTTQWKDDAAAHAYQPGGVHSPDMQASVEMILDRHEHQPKERQITQTPPNEIRDHKIMPQLTRWKTFCEMAGSMTPPKLLTWQEWRALPADEMRWTVMAGEQQIGNQSDQAVFSEHHQTPNSLRTTDGEIFVRTRGEQ